MTRLPEPRTAEINGVTMIILDSDEYERFSQARRQVGGYANRLNMLKHQARTVAEILEAITVEITPHADTHDPADPTLDCPLCRIRGHLDRRPVIRHP